MQITRKQSVITVRHEFTAPDEVFRCMLMSDIHYDSAKCDMPLLKRHLSFANELGMLVLCTGDFFDAMQGKDDPRRLPEELKAEYSVASYFDALVKDAARFLSAYPKCKFILALGNHETSVLKHNGTNLLDRLADKLRDKYEIEAINAPYGDYVRFMFQNSNKRDSKKLYYHHGGGAAAPVTKGVMESYRTSQSFVADIYHVGHNHKQYTYADPYYDLNAAGNLVLCNRYFVRTPGYKMNALESGDEFGYDLERHPTPGARGCAVVKFTRPDKSTNNTHIQIDAHLNA